MFKVKVRVNVRPRVTVRVMVKSHLGFTLMLGLRIWRGLISDLGPGQ